MNYLILFLLLALISIIDIKHKYVYEGMSLLGVLIGLNYQFYQGNVGMALMGMNVGILIVFAMNVINLNKLGGGDLKTMMLCGCFLGWEAVLFITLFAFVLCQIYRKVRHNNKTLAYTPFITVATLLFVIGQLIHGQVNSF